MKKILKSIIEYLTNRQDQKLEDDPVWLENAKEFQKAINYNFENISLLRAAFMHLSYFRKNNNDPKAISAFERMEFLGDSILGLVVAEELFMKFPESPEGTLSKLKSKIVSEKFLAMKALTLDLGKFILMSEEERRSGGAQRKSILSDAMESLICAIYLDSNLVKARRFIKKFIFEGFELLVKTDALTNFKSKLQEYSQSLYQKPPEYTVVNEEGPDHKKVFSVEVSVNGKKCGFGKGSNKKQAEQNAAKDACASLEI